MVHSSERGIFLARHGLRSNQDVSFFVQRLPVSDPVIGLRQGETGSLVFMTIECARALALDLQLIGEAKLASQIATQLNRLLSTMD